MDSISRLLFNRHSQLNDCRRTARSFSALCAAWPPQAARYLSRAGLSLALLSLACSAEESQPDAPDWTEASGARDGVGGGTGSAAGGANAQPGLGGESGEIEQGDYPPGPYGSGNPQVGDVVEDLAWQGFLHLGDGRVATAGPLVEIQLSSLRTAGKSYALIHTATAWCPSCRAAADDLAARGEELEAQGAVLIELLLEGSSSQIPTDAELEAWVQGSDLTVTTVRAADERTTTVFPAREYVYLIELSTMKVVWAERALYASPSITARGIDELLTYL